MWDLAEDPGEGPLTEATNPQSLGVLRNIFGVVDWSLSTLGSMNLLRIYLP